MIFLGICKNASSSLWKIIHGTRGIYPTTHGQHRTLYQRANEHKRNTKVVLVTRHPYSRWMSMYTFLQYQPQWKNLCPDTVLDRIRKEQLAGNLDPVKIGRTRLDVVFCPQWTWLAKTPEEAKNILKSKNTVVMNFHDLANETARKLPGLKTTVKHENKTPVKRKKIYTRMTPQQKRMIQLIFADDFKLFGWNSAWDPQSNCVPAYRFSKRM